jgi:hypothetical protein
MTRRSRLAAILAVLLLILPFVTAGCTSNPVQYNDGNDVWKWSHRGNASEIILNDKLYAVIQSGIAKVYLPDGRSLDISLDKNGAPVSITRMSWEVQLSQQDYQQMNTAFYMYRQATAERPQGSLGWVILLLVLILAGVLLFIYAGSLVNSWKLGGIFSGTDTARSLLLFKAIGIVVIVVGAIILLAVIF